MSNENNWNRRDFLRSSTAALTAAGAMSTARAAEDDAPIRIAVIGTGGRGCDLIRNLSTIEGAVIVAVCDDYEPHLKEGQKFAGPQAKSFADHRKMLSDAKPQAVVVATPLYMHYAVCVDAIDAGAAVFCEKTMCHSIEEARKLRQKVTEKKAVFQVGLQRRANPIYHQAKAMAETGMIGQISAIKAQWHRNNNWRRPVPVPRDHADWQKLEHRLNWRLYWPYSQGLMTELGSHQLDVASWFLGEAAPKRVMATGGIDHWRDGREVFDNLFCIFEWEMETKGKAADATPQAAKTVRVTYSSLQNNAYEGASELIMGTRGSLFLTESKGMMWQEKEADLVGWSAKDKDKNASIVTSGKTLGLSNDPWAHRGKAVEIDSDSNPTRDELLSFIDHVRTGDRQTIADVNVGARNTAVSVMANQAIKEGKTIEFPGDLV